jgi:hypothetical protein
MLKEREACIRVFCISVFFTALFQHYIHEQVFNTFSSNLQPICFTFEFEFNSIIYLHLVLIQLH